jgi:hypothetical protein
MHLQTCQEAGIRIFKAIDVLDEAKSQKKSAPSESADKVKKQELDHKFLADL